MRLCQYKNCSYPVFSTDKITRIGYCKNHQFARTDTDRRSILQKAMDKAKPGTRTIGIQSATELDAWFDDRMKESLPVCMNCGMEANWLLQPEYKKIWKACQAHILPKRKTMFPSVATNPLNHMILFPVWGGHLCGCHDEYDSSWFNATAMKVWEIAVHRFKEFEDEIATKERHRIPEQFIKNKEQ